MGRNLSDCDFQTQKSKSEDFNNEKESNSHPAVLDGFITAYRKHVKEFKEQLDKEENKEQMSENTRDYTKITARGDKWTIVKEIDRKKRR